MPRVTKPQKPRHDPLHVELAQDDSLKKFGRVTVPGKRRKGDFQSNGVDAEEKEDGAGENARMSRKILDLAREQQDEVALEMGQGMGMDDDDDEEEEGGMGEP